MIMCDSHDGITRFSHISVFAVKVVQISQASPAWHDFLDYVDAILLDGLKQCTLVSLRSMFRRLTHATEKEVELPTE